MTIPSTNPLPVPYLIDPWHFAIDDTASFCVAALIAITVNAEAQSLVAGLLGDSRPGAKDRLHFNAFLHIDLWGAICFLVGGFGWPRQVDYDPAKFNHPRLYMILTRFAGPAANFLMANIAASIIWILGSMSSDARVFEMVAVVNLTVAVFNLLPIPPLAGSSLLPLLLQDQYEKYRDRIVLAGPFILIAIFAIERISQWGFISSIFVPMIRALLALIKA